MNLFAELKRRNVIRVGIAYLLLGWVVLQGADFALDLIGAPEWVIRTLAIVGLVGLPFALFFAWAFEWTPEGIKREAEIERGASAMPATGRKLDGMIIALLVIAVAFLLFDRYRPPNGDLTSGTHATAGSGENAQRRVAVLPFVNMSPDPDNEYFSDGISEEILNVLAGVPELKVAARTSAFAFKGSDLGIAEIADRLDVDYVLEGSVRKAGEQVRVTAQLIKADDGFHVWSDNYDRQLDNIFAIQDEIAANIADVLEVHLLGADEGFTTVQDLSPEIYEKFLKARFLMRRRDDASMEQATGLAREVTDAYPDFPRGLGQLAEALAQQHYRAGDALGIEIKRLVDRALDLDPDLATAHMINGHIAMMENRLLDAIRHLEHAIELEPAEPRPHHWLGIWYSNAGYLDAAARELRTAVELEPDHANAHGYLGFVLLLSGDLDNARRHMAEQVRLGNPFGLSRGVQLAALEGDLEAARSGIARIASAKSDDPERLRLFVDAIEDPVMKGTYIKYLDTHDFEGWHAALELMILGEFTRSIDTEVGGYPRTAWGSAWPEARAVPAFMRQVEQARLPEVWEALGLPAACRAAADGYDCTGVIQP